MTERQDVSEAKLLERERCAKIADRIGDRIMRKANKAHREEKWDIYEELEMQAVVTSEIATKIRRGR